MKTAICVDSRHHGNTRKLVDAIAAAHEDVTVVDLGKKETVNFAAYSCIGLASGIAFGHFYDTVTELAGKIPAGKKVILIYTCGSMKKDQAKEMKQLLEERGTRLIGTYHCTGWDTFGPFRVLGGINRRHPDDRDVAGALSFYEAMCSR